MRKIVATCVAVVALAATTSAQAAPKVGTIGPNNPMCTVLGEAHKYIAIAESMSREKFWDAIPRTNFDWSCRLTVGYEQAELIKTNGTMVCIRPTDERHCYWTRTKWFGLNN